MLFVFHIDSTHVIGGIILDFEFNFSKIFVLPKISTSNDAAGPDLNGTPFGKNFNWRKTFDRTVSCGIMQYLKVANDDEKGVTATLVQLGSVYDAPTNPSKNGCLVSVR